ncbi:hypothetical protein INR49_010323 [Caranx melampygus]|nr:hypothetical protein INR49_010323 [Caranx melampygus]
MDQSHSHTWDRYHESQLSEADWHLHSTHDPDEVQVDPRALSDVTDEEEVQVDPRKYADGDREKFLDEPSFDYSSLFPPERSWQDDHHENKYCDLQCSHTCNYKAVSPSYLDNLIWRDSEVNHYYEPKLIIDLSNWKEQQSKEKADRKAKSKCEKNGLVKAQIALQEAEKTQSPHHQTEPAAGACQEVALLSEVGLLNELNSSVSQLEAPRSGSMSKSISQEKEEKCLVNLAQLGGGGGGSCVVGGDSAWPAQPWESFGRGESRGERLPDRRGVLGHRQRRPLPEGEHLHSYLDRLFSRKEDGGGETVAGPEPEPEPSEGRELDDGFLGRSAEIVLNVQLDSLALPVFDSADDLPLKSIQASLTPCAVKCSPQIAHKTYSSIFKHLN